MNDISKGMAAMALIGGLFSEPQKHINIMPFVVSGDMDKEIYLGFHFTKYGPSAEFKENDPELNLLVERLKTTVREFIQAIFYAAAREEEMEKKMELERTRASLKESNKPHEIGTVAEIAARYGISKSEVRRRKAEGTLGELFKKQLT